jgi:hypothetical protein
MKGEARQDGWREDVRIYFNKLRGGERGLKVEICEVHGPKKGIRRDNRVEEDIYAGKRSD